jgi:hypothetical protein
MLHKLIIGLAAASIGFVGPAVATTGATPPNPDQAVIRSPADAPLSADVGAGANGAKTPLIRVAPTGPNWKGQGGRKGA